MASPPSADDIAYIRHLSESGAKAPLIGGRFTAWWGLLLVAAYVAMHLAVNGMLGASTMIFGFIWGSLAVLGLIGQFALARTIRDKPGAGSAGNLAARSVWTAAALSIGAMVIGSALISNGSGPAGGPQPWDFIVPVAFAVYACAQYVTGALAGNRMLKLAGLGAVVMVGLFTALSRWPDRYLLVAAGVALTVLIPGLLLMRAEPKG